MTSNEQARYGTALQHLESAGQAHVLHFWKQLTSSEREKLLLHVESLDLSLVQSLAAKHASGSTARLTAQADAAPPPPPQPPPVTALPSASEHQTERDRLANIGHQAIAGGKVCAIMAAGGQSSRLGSDAPKALFPASPITQRPLVDLFAETLATVAQRSGVEEIRWYIMTSNATHDALVAAFEANAHYGLPHGAVHFARQRELPAIDLQGRLILAQRDQLALAPNGHGGLFEALRNSGALDDMRAHDLETAFYFQVDNPLCPILDPVHLGLHYDQGAEMTVKVLEKRDPDEKVGLVVQRDDRLAVVEYTEIDKETRRSRDGNGSLRLRAGNIAIHTFSVDFLEKAAGLDLVYHASRKQIAHVTPEGLQVSPKEPNGLKFERFLFDVLPLAKPAIAIESLRCEEFAPIKNAQGEDSPDSSRKAQIERAALWIEASGGFVPRLPDGTSRHAIEIRPRTALSREDFVSKFSPNPPVVESDLVL